MLSVIHSPKPQKLPKLWERVREIIVVFLQLPPWVLRCVGETTVFRDSLTKRRGGPEGSGDCSPSPTSLKHIFPFVTNSCVFLIMAATYSLCCFPTTILENLIHFIYRALLVHFTQTSADNELTWPFTRNGWQALDTTFSLHLSTLGPLLVRADTEKAGSVKACLQHFHKGRVLSAPLTTVSSASRTVPGTS